jgi:hypothetical protein
MYVYQKVILGALNFEASILGCETMRVCLVVKPVLLPTVCLFINRI